MNYLFPIVEVLLIALMLNYIFSFLWNTRSMDLVIGCVAFLLMLAISSWLDLPVLHKTMVFFGNIAPIALVILFQPELRLALSRLGLKGRRHREFTDFERFLEQLTSSIYRMSEMRIGALLAMEKDVSLEEYVQKSVLVNATFSSELIETIFAPNTPLHDGAVILRGPTILSAAVIFPLTEDSPESGKVTSMGTRHRAALGLSQITDALIIIVSEETGKVSIAREGAITRGINADRFKGILRSLFTPEIKQKANIKQVLSEWLKT